MKRSKRIEKGSARPLVLAAAALVIIGISATIITASVVLSRSEGCAVCHQMRSRVGTWQIGIHGKKKVACLDCHAEEGQLNQALAHIAGAKYVFAYFADAPLVSKVPNSRCLRCHFPEKKREVDKTAQLHFDALLNKGVFCSDCHRALAHTVQGAAARPAKEKHKCGRCHPVEFYDWRQSTAIRRTDCVDCHRAQTSHTNAPSRANSPRLSLTADVCLRCHGSEGKDPGWRLSRHAEPSDKAAMRKQTAGLGVTGKTDGVTCSVCHNPHTTRTRGGSSGLCLSCHKTSDMFTGDRSTVIAWPEPSFQKQHLDNKVSCIDCHIKDDSSTGDTRTQHGFRAVVTKCAVCHPGFDLTGVPAS